MSMSFYSFLFIIFIIIILSLRVNLKNKKKGKNLAKHHPQLRVVRVQQPPATAVAITTASRYKKRRMNDNFGHVNIK